MSSSETAPRSRTSLFWRLNKFFSSLKLAVVIILALAAITAWGTFVEAELDATAAQKIVYHSVWMYGVMAMLALCLIAVMVDRWPWKVKHTGFIFAHVGILVLLLGAIITRYFGVDGSLTFGVGEKAHQVVVGETDFAVYASMDGSSYRKIFDREADFFTDPPSAEKPLEVDYPGGRIRVVEYLPYALREEKIVESSEASAGAAIRFQLQNPNVSMTEWLVQGAQGREVVKDLGPAQVVLTSVPYLNIDQRNTVVLRPKNETEIEYEIHTKREGGSVRRGVARPGDIVETGWMGLVLRILKFMPKAKEDVSFRRIDKPTPLTTPVIRIERVGLDGKAAPGDSHWLSLNSLLKLFSDQAVYVVTYANRRIDLKKEISPDFEIRLKEFRIGRYPGTMRAASYESLVEIPGKGETVISMNEPLKHAGYTFYQASFQEDEQGRPVASVLSVNRDPGRWLKYLGSLLIVLGTIHLFYFRMNSSRKS